ncbi:MAG: glutaredoxin family protein [Promethearchaeota archaeon]
MTDMFEGIPFVQESGTVNKNNIKLFALSTCGFCRRGMNYLRDQSIEFSYVYVDQIPFEQKQELKEKLKKKFEKRVAFPFVVVNESVAMVGFLQKEWDSHIM